LREERVVDRTANDSVRRGFLHRCEVFLGVEGHERESFPDVFEKQQNLLSAEAVPARRTGQGGVAAQRVSQTLRRAEDSDIRTPSR
jgi:hypothetical protein